MFSDLPEVVDPPRYQQHKPTERDLPKIPESVYSYDSQPEVVRSDLPQVVPRSFESDKYPLNPQTIDPTRQVDEAVHPKPPKRQIICGLKRRTFYIVAVVSTFVFIVVFGVVSGVVTRSNNNDNNNNSSQNPSPGSPNNPGNLSPATSLSATEVTDLAGNTHVYLFYQDKRNQILVTMWDSKTAEWATYPVSNASMSILPDTPLAAFSYRNPTSLLDVYYLDTSNTIRRLQTQDAYPLDGLSPAPLGSSSQSLVAGKGSRLALLRPQCEGSSKCSVSDQVLAYQTSSGMITIASLFDSRTKPIGVATNGSVIGLASVIDKDLLTRDDVLWRLMVDEGGSLQEYQSEAAILDWAREKSHGGINSSDVASFDMFSFDTTNTMTLAVTKDGTATARWLDDDGIGDFTTSPGGTQGFKFTALAGTNGKRIFGVADGTLHEWGFDAKSPGTWRYVGVVPT
ncbi:hypothetical protein OQA88_11039 [Cercophora sp. LCS_1]